ncbi:5'-methylthioadenosine/adenosylhomocysteine nucleosidase [Marinicrinis lubricantis]|uniref:adenosylhomocysteine nucleosidase n=1 Tax=Marinicrinis lubricantis TaxID=2086470 RepID=A0ABW1IQL7_9BACL
MRKIGIIGAMVEEVQLFEGHMTDTQAITKAGISFMSGQMHESQVVVTKCGVGKVNAAVCTQILIDHFQVEAVLFTGVAGALDPRLDIGDLVISIDCMQHDMDVTALGFERGVIPYQDRSIFEADRELVELAYGIGEKLFESNVYRGRVLSGDQFIADRTKVKELHEELGGTCTEMEGAAVAQVCSMNDTRFVVIRSMSDRADGTAHMNFAEFTQLAANRSFQMVEAIIQEMR